VQLFEYFRVYFVLNNFIFQLDFGGPLILNGEMVAINIGLSIFNKHEPDSSNINFHLNICYYKEFINFHKTL
jgi:hypothetical protein